MAFHLTDAAATEVRRLLATEPIGTRLRYDVIGDCRAARTKLYLGPVESESEDRMFEVGGVPMVVARSVNDNLGDVKIDFNGEQFAITHL
jgi:Fe-S cluster assembly iron-binding protein IscA